MPNPKAPRRSRQSAESQSPLDALVERLRRLGADAEEVQTVIDRWDDFDEDWTAERRAELLSWSDDQLRAALTDTRDEFAEGTGDTEQAERDRAVQLDNALAEARDIVGLAVPKLLEWVGDDPVRAEAMLTVENEATDPRKTLVEPLEQLARPVGDETPPEPQPAVSDDESGTSGDGTSEGDGAES